MRSLKLIGTAGLLLGLIGPVRAQHAANDDGFQRRNGEMQVVRNGQARPMTRDARLPTGATVTKDGFIVAANGHRTELREGQGCDLRGRPVAVRTTATGALALDAPTASARPVVVRESPSDHGVLAEIFGSGDDEGRSYKFKKPKKHHGKGKGHGRWKGEDD
ncbi:DUF6799 domain-containing protein [Hymenobacter terricola]|uniref:DUF6799 domain-containing protein n=1 Tax=Hymenobacter terricola TaxID=2819236 RepID=UPI001B30897A|nr:DUF6799 domain-containing protein [Hymenobacter terricola]